MPALSLVLLLPLPPPGPADRPGPRCEWSAAWQRLAFPPFGPTARLVAPRRRKGKVRLPSPKRAHEIEGRWTVQVAIDATGRTLDAQVIERPRVSPPWPEFEPAVLKDVKKLEWTPATADGVPVPVCLDLPVFSTPRRIDRIE